MQPVYFAHGYREREAPFAAYFGKILPKSGLMPSLDPPSEAVNSAKLERHLRHTKGLVAVVADRGGGVISPHILFEINLCIRSGFPLLVFLEDTLRSDVVPRHLIKCRFSSRSYYREAREHQHAVENLRAFFGAENVPRYQPTSERRSCLLIGFTTLSDSFAAGLKSLIDGMGYECVEVPSERMHLPPGEFFIEAVRSASLAIAVLDDNSESSMYFLGVAQAGLVPTIMISRNQAYPLRGDVPSEYQRVVISRDDVPSGITEVRRQIILFEEDFVAIENNVEAEDYANMLIKSASRPGQYNEDTRTTIIRELTMGDKYTVGQAGAVGPNSKAHDNVFQQAWNQQSNTLDLSVLAEQLEKLRRAMRAEGTTVDNDKALAAVAAAEEAARKGDGANALQNLKAAGSWAIDVATKIGTTVAAKAITTAMGI